MMGNYDEAVRYGLQAVKTADEMRDTSLNLCAIYNRLALTYMETKERDLARGYFEKSLAVAEKYNNASDICCLVSNFVDMLLKMDKAPEAVQFISRKLQQHPVLERSYKTDIGCMMIRLYCYLQQYDKARPWVDIVEKALPQITDYELEANSYKRLTNYYIETQQFQKAAASSAGYDRFCQRIHSAVYRADNHLLKYKIDSATGHFIAALQQIATYRKIKDSMFNERKSNQISQLNILYETDKKNKNIHILEQQTALQQSSLRQASLIRNFGLGGVALLLLILFLLYKGYRIKQKNNQLLEKHQEEINQKNQSLQHLVQEKEWLLKEIHHRVKNNLHMVVGLLASQTEFLKGKEAVEAISESQHRIQSMSLIHQKLYQTENLSTIDMPSYIQELVDYLRSSFDKNLPIRFVLNIAKVEFPLSHSIPLGLILNEAITNAIKYAFPHGRSGEIKIALQETEPEQYVLQIKDNGIGLPAAFDHNQNNTLGTTLMQGLSDDIGATFTMRSEQGTIIEVTFAQAELINHTELIIPH
jgi:two-component sensor histidine kinase